VSIIEATMKEKSYTDFFGWLNSRQRVKFPICDKCQLEEHYREYLQVHGAAKKISKFLGFLDVAERESLSKDIGLSGEDTIEKISNRLYELRSDFVHNGAPIWELDSHTAFTRRRNKDIVVRLQLEGFCKLFELCFLRYFGLLQAAERDSTLN
jgi:hypothetical protein